MEQPVFHWTPSVGVSVVLLMCALLRMTETDGGYRCRNGQGNVAGLDAYADIKLAAPGCCSNAALSCAAASMHIWAKTTRMRMSRFQGRRQSVRGDQSGKSDNVRRS